MSDLAEIGSGGRRDLGNATLEAAHERERSSAMRHEHDRRILDRLDDLGIELRQLDSLVRALRRELAELRVRVRDTEHDLDDLRASRR